MGLLDSLKGRLGPARDKVSDLAQHHGGTVGHGLDRAAKAVDDRTGHRYSGRIRAGTGRAKDAMDRLAQRGGAGTGRSDGTGPEGSPPRS
ncbi:antitoxin [Streptomyces sp. NPDC047000]|uniref:antitoxin n=1 Tax=Streptomyces sp. NPDC047000 TaxID=3155474 RepID=UPI0033C2F0FB